MLAVVEHVIRLICCYTYPVSKSNWTTAVHGAGAGVLVLTKATVVLNESLLDSILYTITSLPSGHSWYFACVRAIMENAVA